MIFGVSWKVFFLRSLWLGAKVIGDEENASNIHRLVVQQLRLEELNAKALLFGTICEIMEAFDLDTSGLEPAYQQLRHDMNQLEIDCEQEDENG